MAIGYVVSIVVEDKPVLFWQEMADDARGKWTKNAQLATRAYDSKSAMERYNRSGNSELIPGFDVVVIEERIVVSAMTERVFKRRQRRRSKSEATAD